MMIVKVGHSSPLGALTFSNGYADLQFNNCNLNLMEHLTFSDVHQAVKGMWTHAQKPSCIILSVHLKEMLVKHSCR
jgi:hypothetical protein